MNVNRIRLYHLFGSALLCLSLTASTTLADPLETGFLNPPDSAKPHTWWQWMNGNITQEGITADLEAMKQIGLGGATIVNADCGIPRGPVPFMSPEWQDDFKYAITEAHRLGKRVVVHARGKEAILYSACAGVDLIFHGHASLNCWSQFTPANLKQRLSEE